MGKKYQRFTLILLFFVFCWGGMEVYCQETIQDDSLTSPKELWERCQETLSPFSYKVLKDEVVPSTTDPRQELRRIEVRFTSQVVGQWGRRMVHTAVIHMPADPKIYQAPERRGKVVVISNRFGDKMMINDYGEPIAARMGYPTMVLPIPGEYDGHDGESCWVYFFRSRLSDTKDPMDHQYFRFAIPYISALDVFGGILGEKKIRAVIGGHSKRAPDYGQVRIDVNDSPVGEIVDTFLKTDDLTRPIWPPKAFTFPEVTLEEGINRLRFTIDSKNPEAEGYKVGIDCLVLEKRR